ncbi:hypothetical protein ACOZZ4_004132 [Cronobacter dublinensis]|uniref:hypothetical protein n=1 Tax=Cronobacter TaxID=413496 RepID=UPI000CFBFBDB|nr:MULTISPECIES: hypothetical protein [Cronobacter]ELY5820595.1 hypothetical protein [Cronobacter dublinensis]EGT5208985.1 hypothetical protein [Cronobacter sakazakii]EGT5755600.1 hypothetical protein [Cronobacter sakazakii]EJG0817479.1 hypothetical protein [Cronobacter sakazakii]EJG2181095.1 hypothetical protein [Cronobacter sakazakii]
MSASDVDFELKIDSGKTLVDMEYGLETMSGFSGAIAITADCILSNEVPSQMNYSANVRAKLMSACLGSYIQDFKLVVSDPVKSAKLAQIGNSVLSELITYFICETMYVEPPALTKKAERLLSKLEKIESKIIDRIHERVKDMHKVSRSSKYPVILKRKTQLRTFKLLEINEATSSNLFNLTTDQQPEEINAIITRFNLFTGNGRLLADGFATTIPFSFSGPYSKVKSSIKRMMSENLHNNNAIEDEDIVRLRITAKARRNTSGDVVKYLIDTVVKP